MSLKKDATKLFRDSTAAQRGVKSMGWVSLTSYFENRGIPAAAVKRAVMTGQLRPVSPCSALSSMVFLTADIERAERAILYHGVGDVKKVIAALYALGEDPEITASTVRTPSLFLRYTPQGEIIEARKEQQA